LIPLGTLITIVYSRNPWGLILLFFPILLVHYSFEHYQRLRTESMRTIELLAEAIDKRDHYTFQHSQKVAEYSEKIARKLGLDLNDIEAVVSAARIHDLGKIGTDTNILSKPTGLKEEEWRKIKEHPSAGAEIISGLSLYDEVKDLVAHHQERYDGNGYPTGLKGEKIPLGARILAVADAFDAMTSDRPYRRAMSYEQAVAELEAGKGTQFDPKIVDAFLAAMEEERQRARIGKPELLARQQGDLS
jgi:putative nucleotidyltransferase with HDIG domain